MKSLLSVFAALVFLLAPAAARATDETLPVEVALTYYKFLNQEPPYVAMIQNNEALLKKSEGFGQNAILEQQRKSLQNIYDGINKEEALIFTTKKIMLDAIDSETRRLSFSGISPDLPFIYSLNSWEKFGIFVRNANEVRSPVPPYEFDDFTNLNSFFNTKRFVFPMEITLKALAADPKDFTLNDGMKVHVLVADIVEIKIIDPNGTRLFLQKRFKGWKPEGSKNDSLFPSDLMPTPSP